MRILTSRTWILGLFASGGLLAGSTPGLTQQAGSVVEGARIYGDVCGTCHNPRSPLERSDRDWVTIVNHMRVRANMSGQQARDVLAFLQATNQDPRQEANIPRETGDPAIGVQQAGEVAQGERLVGEKACLGCHIIGDGGGNIGPSLNGVVSRKGADDVARKIVDPTFDSSTSMMPNFGLSEEEAGWITAYLATVNNN
jgi:mono/diheme cytochrome c family protein